MFVLTTAPNVAPLRVAPVTPKSRVSSTTTRAFMTKEKPKASTKKTTQPKQRLTQEDSMKEMSSIVAQAFGVGIALPVGEVGLLEASKNLAPSGSDADVGLYGFIALCAGCAVWWGAKTATRDALRIELEAKGLDMSTVDNISVLRWVKKQDEIGKGKQAVKEIYKAYETEANPWSPFFKPAGVGKGGPKK